jgi:hypothetical protein
MWQRCYWLQPKACRKEYDDTQNGIDKTQRYHEAIERKGIKINWNKTLHNLS